MWVIFNKKYIGIYRLLRKSVSTAPLYWKEKLTTDAHQEIFFYDVLYSPHKPPEDVGKSRSITSHVPLSQWNVQLCCWLSQWASCWQITRQRSAKGCSRAFWSFLSVSTTLYSPGDGHQPRTRQGWLQVGGWSNKETLMLPRTCANNSHSIWWIRWSLINKVWKMPLFFVPSLLLWASLPLECLNNSTMKDTSWYAINRNKDPTTGTLGAFSVRDSH